MKQAYFSGTGEVYLENRRRYKELICSTLNTNDDSELFDEAIVLINSSIPFANDEDLVLELVLGSFLNNKTN